MSRYMVKINSGAILRGLCRIDQLTYVLVNDYLMSYTSSNDNDMNWVALWIAKSKTSFYLDEQDIEHVCVR
jgi:hypothetical protein